MEIGVSYFAYLAARSIILVGTINFNFKASVGLVYPSRIHSRNLEEVL
jgi:hypothetical protein